MRSSAEPGRASRRKSSRRRCSASVVSHTPPRSGSVAPSPGYVYRNDAGFTASMPISTAQPSTEDSVSRAFVAVLRVGQFDTMRWMLSLLTWSSSMLPSAGRMRRRRSRS